MANFLTAESLIVARLEAKIAAADWTGKAKPRVFTAYDAAQIEERSQVAPAIYVLFDGHQPEDQVGSGSTTTLGIDWSIVVAVRSAKAHQSGEGIREDAVPLIDLVFDALLGWRPSKDFMPMRASQSPAPEYTDTGFGYFPINFTTRTVARGSVT